ncbi:MAG: acetate--CoA ligase family protein [Steroidobacteraceae bacterium]
MPTMDIRRLIAPRSIALVGAGAWTDAVAAGNAAIGYSGTIWRVHPSRTSTAAATYYRSVADLPATPDATFVAVPNHEAPAVAGALAACGAGGFVCFSAGFAETGTEAGRRLTDELMQSAGALPFFGPNCYGFVNFFDRVAMMPDQIVGESPECGVALICQSGTIALTLMFNDRSLPIGYLFSVGNQARLAVEDLIQILCDDPRVTAFGLYLEGIKDAARFARAADRARAAGKPIAVIKSGRTAAAARTAHSHTGALAGADRIFEAFCRQTGIARCDTLGTLCETLKLFHVGGPLPGNKVLVMGASGGDMAMTADVARDLELNFSDIPPAPAAGLRALLTDRVVIANPFDIHTYLWFDPPALKQVFSAVLHAGFDAAGFMLDCPPEQKADTAAFDSVIDVFIEASHGAPTRAALIASLPETLSVRVRRRCLQNGVIPLQGQREALEALALAGAVGAAWRSNPPVELNLPAADRSAQNDVYALGEREGKSALAGFGLTIPRGKLVAARAAAAAAVELGFPVVIKAAAADLEHKTELGGVALNLRSAAEAAQAAERLSSLSPTLLVEEMITDGIAEILIGIIVDPQFGQVLVLGAGGVFTEIMADSVSLLPPWSCDSIRAGLERLAVAKLLAGFRGRPAADVGALIDAALSVARYAAANVSRLVELDVNPVIVRPRGMGVVAVDAMIRLKTLDLSGGP